MNEPVQQADTAERAAAAVTARIEQAVAALSVGQKVRLLTGADMWSTYPEPAIGLRRLVMSDGPSGVRGEIWDERDPSLNLPSATALAAAWDPELAYEYGAAMAAEARRKGVDVILGPTINLHRSPFGGRHFEAYSEDPVLTGAIATAFVHGVQDQGIAACPKHYIANDFETERFTASVELSDQALRELYLAPFERTVVEAGAWTIMSSYNAVRGVTMTENDLLRSPLCDEWGFDGVVISDWTAVRSLAAAAARQDLVMPGPRGPWGDALVAAVNAGEVPLAAVDEKIRRLLRLAARVGALADAPAAYEPAEDGLLPVDPAAVEPADGRDLDAAGQPLTGNDFARRAEVRAITLVRNVDDLLPLGASAGIASAGIGATGIGAPASIAVIGQSASLPRTQGGGSATVLPAETISPLDGLRAALPDSDITYTLGALVQDSIAPLPLATITDPATGEPGLRVRFSDSGGRVVFEESRSSTSLVWLGNAPAGEIDSLELSTDYRPAESGRILLGVSVVGPTTLSVDGEVLLRSDARVDGEDPGASTLSPPTSTTELAVETGRTYRLIVTHRPPAETRLPGVLSIHLGSRPAADSAQALIDEAVRAASAAEVAVVVVGTNAQVESEGFDRTTLALPGRQDDLVRAVAAANPRTVVVVNSGSPVTLPWRSQVSAILLTWFGGQEYGRALADVLTGAAEPGGRLPTTWPAEEEEVPVLDVTPVDGVLRYDEGIHIGYRAWLRAEVEPAYPFGFGLGYTSFRYDSVSVSARGDGSVEVTVGVTNTGDRTGREVVQVYLSRDRTAVDRPVRWLAGFEGLTLAAGESGTALVLLPLRAFQHWQGAGWAVEPGTFSVSVGSNVAELPLHSEVSLPL